ncbi:MAG: FkbM family methyltransferase, partial [Conexivisphaerales archaeon]
FNVLNENIEKNKATNIIPEKLALSDKAGEFSISGVAGGASLSSSGIEKVKVTTIDKFVQDQKLDRVDFIKMDIEGAELGALKGGQETIKRFNFHLDFNKRYDKIIISCSNE